MKTMFRKMTLEEFDTFSEWSFKNHVNELMRENNISEEHAISQTQQEVKEMLPNGIETADNFLISIKDISRKRNVGFIWYLHEITNGIKQCFLCDFVINESERRKGYATEALKLMEKRAIQSGCKECILFVAKENEPAQKLYFNCGYVF